MRIKHIIILILLIILSGCVLVYKSRDIDVNNELKGPGIDIEAPQDSIQ